MFSSSKSNVQHAEGWWTSRTAVVRGALMKGLAEVTDVKPKLATVRVASRIVRKYYGTECLTLYVEGSHSKKTRYVHGFMPFPLVC